MATLTIGNRDVEVSDDFLKLSPDQQNETVEEIAQSLGIAGGGASAAPEEPELTAGRAAGLTGRMAVQAAPGAALGLPAMAYDAVVNLPRYLTKEAYNAAARQFGWQETPLNDPLATTKALGQAGELAADTVGLPRPETPEERVVVAGGQTALEALGGAGLAKAGGKAAGELPAFARQVLTDLGEAPIAQGAIGGLAGGGAQLAAENDVNPLVGMGLGLGAGLAGAATAHAIPGGVRAARGAIDRTLARGEATRQQLAAERVRNAASNPDAAFRELDEGAGAELVPGSRPTTFQATGDVGLGSLERELQTANPEAFAQRRGAQNSARLESLRSVGGDGNADEIITFLRGQLDDIDRATLGDETAARARAESAAGDIRPSDDVGAVGRSIRDSMRDAEDAARARESALWDAVDPDGNLTVSTQSAKQIANELYAKMTESGRLGLSSDEKEVADLIRRYRPIEAFRELQDLSSRIKSAMREELRQRGRTPSYARLVRLNQAIRSGMENSAAERIAADPSIRSAVSRWADEWNAGREASRTGGEASQVRALRTGTVSGLGGGESAQGGQLGGFARNPGVQGQARQGNALSLSQFIAKNGGLPLDAEAAARDWGNVSVGRFGKLARPNGHSIDGYWRNKLIDEGYLPRDADGYSSRDITRELYDAIENERAGRKTYTAADEMRAGGGADDGREAEFLAASRQLQDELQRAGVRSDEMSAWAFNDAVERLAAGEEADAITAYERAVMGLEDEGPTHAQYASREGVSAGSLLDGFRDDPKAGARYKAATAATRERVGTYNKGYAGQILRRDGEKDIFRMGDASVATNAFRAGPTGGERVKALVKAGAKPSEIADAAALSLHKMALKADGTIDPKKFQQWRSAHADALRELPENVRARFANASLASQALERAAAARKTHLEEFNKSVLGKLAKVDPADLPKEIGRILNARDAASQMIKLSQAARGNRQAKDALRRAVAEHIESRFISNKEVAASGENSIRADAFASFVKDKAPALRQVFSGDDLLRMRAIADDIRRAERSLQATRIPGNSNTAADITPALEKATKEAGKSSLLMQMMIAGGAGFMAGGPKGAVLGAGGAWAKNVAGAMRAAGLKRVDDLVLEMMLDPGLAKVALMKQPIASKGAQQLLTQRLAKLSPFAVSSSSGGFNER